MPGPVLTTSPSSSTRQGRRGAEPRRRRVVREAVVVGLVVLSMTFSLGVEPETEVVPRLATVVVVVVLLLLRGRAPLAVTAGTALLMLTGQPVQVAALVALLQVAVRSSWRRTSVAAGLLLVGYAAALVVHRSTPWAAWLESAAVLVTGAVLLLGATAGAGLYAGARRQLLAEARERADRAEADRARHAERARERERARIAREMHDVLAHRLTVLALHAGALEYGARATGGEVAETAGVVRESAHRALQELRDVLGVLRAASDDGPDDAGGGGLRPPPALADVQGLVDEAAAATGSPVRLTVDGDLDAVSAPTGRAAYRVVQEGLTNARRHAPGAAVLVVVRVPAGSGDVVVEVRNDPPPPAAGAPPVAGLAGRGSGLLGVAERAALLGGQVEHGPTPDGGHRLAVRLPGAGTGAGAGPGAGTDGRPAAGGPPPALEGSGA
ncbi:histidine kinase [Pseudokineococcus sp. 5B2Z-1]|uniref:sensor histidine kinase n=1 Tax=Pseudokineococcus sp. 5B2Z-1 TaxID=3132744 RepID=UPI0030B799AF